MSISKDIYKSIYRNHLFHQALQGALKGLLDGDGYAIVHDAFHLPESKEKDARQIMQDTAEKWFGLKDLF